MTWVLIRDRVATRGSSTDAFPGLGLKAYLMLERGVEGSEVNQYALFYLWTSISGMSRFLWDGAGFNGLVESFGHPAVRHWTGVAFAPGASASATPLMATRSIRVLTPEMDLVEAVASARAHLQQFAHLHGVHSTALAIDSLSLGIGPFHLMGGSRTGRFGDAI